jgi:hypothetical protein
MNILTAKSRLPQLRMRPVPGTPLFRYERRVLNRWVSCNHSRASRIVGVFNRKAKKLCGMSTGGFVTEEASPSASFGGSQNRGELSICGLTTPMNASARSSSSSVNSEK